MENNFSETYEGCHIAPHCSVQPGLALEDQLHFVFRRTCGHLMHVYKAADDRIMYYCTRNYMITDNSSQSSQ